MTTEPLTVAELDELAALLPTITRWAAALASEHCAMDHVGDSPTPLLRALIAGAKYLKVCRDVLPRLIAAARRCAELEAVVNEIQAELASEGPRTIEHLLAVSAIGKHTTVVGRKRLEKLHETEAAFDAVLKDRESLVQENDRLRQRLGE